MASPEAVEAVQLAMKSIELPFYKRPGPIVLTLFVAAFLIVGCIMAFRGLSPPPPPKTSLVEKQVVSTQPPSGLVPTTKVDQSDTLAPNHTGVQRAVFADSTKTPPPKKKPSPSRPSAQQVEDDAERAMSRSRRAMRITTPGREGTHWELWRGNEQFFGDTTNLSKRQKVPRASSTN